MILYKSTLTIIVMALLFSALVPFYTSLPRTSFIEPVYAQSTVPITGAMVIVTGSNGSEYAISGSSGGYQIVEGLGTGEYSAVVMAKGYIDGKVEKIQVIAGQETSGIDFLLKRSGAISGKVTGPGGQPLKGILVYATQTEGTGGNASSYALTGEDGSYFIYSGLSTGTYNVTAGFYSTGYISQTQSNINVVEVQETSNLNFQLEVSGTISGTVTTTEGIPLANVIVMATSSDGNYYGFAYTDVNGNYRIDTNLGTSTYTVYAYKGMIPAFISDVSVTAGQETANIDFQISITPSGSISGRVTDTGENPIQGATVSASGPAGYGSAETDSNGYYIISEGLDTGSYTVSATASGYNPSSPNNVSVTVNQETNDVNFQLQKISGTTSGSISGQVNGESNPIVPPSTTSLTSTTSTSTTSTSTTSTSTTSTSSSETTTSTTESSTTTSETTTTSSSTSTSITETTPFPWIYVIIGVVVVVIIFGVVFALRMRKPKV